MDIGERRDRQGRPDGGDRPPLRLRPHPGDAPGRRAAPAAPRRADWKTRRRSAYPRRELGLQEVGHTA